MMPIRKLVPKRLVAQRRLDAENRKIIAAAEQLMLDAGQITEEDRARRAALENIASGRAGPASIPQS